MNEQSFAIFDTDGSGTLTAEECVALLTRQSGGAPMSLADAKEFVADFDVNGDGVLDYREICQAVGNPTAVLVPDDEVNLVPTAVLAPDDARVARIMNGEAWAAVEAAQVRDGATLWAAYKKQTALIKAGALDSMEMLEWIGAIAHNTRVDCDALVAQGSDHAVHLLILLASDDAPGRFLASTAAPELAVTSDKLSDATRVELFDSWAARTDYLSSARIEAALPMLARIAAASPARGTALGHFGEHELPTVACTCLFHLASADERDELIAKADELGLVDATVAIAAPLVGTSEGRAALYRSGISQTILDALRRPEGFEERIAAALGVEDLQMGLLPDDYWD